MIHEPDPVHVMSSTFSLRSGGGANETKPPASSPAACFGQGPEDAPTVTIGVLYKYVNALQGWRPRLVVLDPIAARLCYYHVAGPSAVRVARVEESLRQQYGGLCEISFVGVQVGVIRKKELAVRSESLGFGSMRGPRDVRDQVHPEELLRVKVVELKRVRESEQDDCKVWVNETLELKAESQDDRRVWAKAMRDVMADGELDVSHQRRYNSPRGDSDGVLVGEVDGVEVRREADLTLDGMGASDEVKRYVFGILDSLIGEWEKRRTMLNILYRLEDEKRELETRLAVEGAMAGDSQDADQDESGSTVADGSEDGEESLERERGRGNDGECEEVFFDAEEGNWDVAGRSSSLGELARFDAACVLVDGGRSGSEMSASLIGSARPVGPTRPTTQSIPVPPRDNAPPSSSYLPAPEGGRRRRLPKPQQQEKAVSLWSLIKEMVGKDLTRVCLPVYFNEPLSALELTAEDLEYSELLDVAASHPAGSMERIVNVMAFAISPYSSTEGRTSKPFNPLLGETYELIDNDKGFRFIAEKVSHHPTIIAAHAVGGWRGGGDGGNKWTYQGDAEIKSKFWGRSIELKPEGVLRLDFEDGDSYSWHKVTTRINNLIIGKIYVDHGGVMTIRRRGDGPSTVAKVFFHETKMLFDRDPRRIEGHLEIDGVPMRFPRLEGHWNEEIHVTWEGGRCERVWIKNPMPEPENRNRYNLTRYAIGLNEITPEMEGRLAPTDSRLRADQRLTELGMWEEANAEKQRLEHKQRAARKAAEEGVPLKPRWFAINQDQVHLNGSARGHHLSSKELGFVFTGEYWRARDQGEFKAVRDIFG